MLIHIINWTPTNEYRPCCHFKKSLVKFVVQMGRFPKADESWRRGEGGSANCWQKLTRGGGGVYEPPFLADVICEQPLIRLHCITSTAAASPDDGEVQPQVRVSLSEWPQNRRWLRIMRQPENIRIERNFRKIKKFLSSNNQFRETREWNLPKDNHTI